MNVGIVGFGSIGTEVAKALLKGVENFYLYKRIYIFNHIFLIHNGSLEIK